jgi:AbiV family abortive infection protein
MSEIDDESHIPAGVMKTILMNQLSGRHNEAKSVYLNTYLESINEAYKLLKESKLLFDNKSWERAYFLAFSALEEISKSQLAADVYTGLISDGEFKRAYKDHKKKIARVEWIKLDGNSYPYSSYDELRIQDFDFQKKLKAMYVDVDFDAEKTSSPSIAIEEHDAASIIKAVEVGLLRIYEVTEENGEQIGTKGFMK